MSPASLLDLIKNLASMPQETEWLEFKTSDVSPKRLGEDISALANSAAFLGRDYAYKIWGVDDATHELIGTTFDPFAQKAKGNQPLLIWLHTKLSNNAVYEFETVEENGLTFVVLTIQAATGQPVYFDKLPYIREGSSTTLLQPASAKERTLWQRLQQSDFLFQAAKEDLTAPEILDALDVESFFSLLEMPLPSSENAIMSFLVDQAFAKAQDNGFYTLTNFGLLVIGKKLSPFFGLRKKALRVIRFEGNSNTAILGDKTFDEGYALALPKAEEFIMEVTPSHEELEGAFRRIKYKFPRPAIRELLSNTVIHQDFSELTSGPLVNLYDNRIQFNNPGVSLIESERILNAPPRSRNIELASILRQMNFCEEGGSGWDIAVEACEEMHLPAPKMLSDDANGTQVSVFCDRAYNRMTKRERIEAVYWHACLLYAKGDAMANQSLRDRFGLGNEKKDIVAISRLIRECCEMGIIKEEDEDAGAKFKRYIPAWG